MAGAKEYQLVIDFTDGTDLTIALSEQPTLSFSSQKLFINVVGQSSEFELSSVSNFHFKEGSSDIESPPVEDDYTIQWKADDQIVISNASHATSIRLYGIDGNTYASQISIANGDCLVISLSGLPKGIYLLNINKHRTIKINRK